MRYLLISLAVIALGAAAPGQDRDPVNQGGPESERERVADALEEEEETAADRAAEIRAREAQRVEEQHPSSVVESEEAETPVTGAEAKTKDQKKRRHSVTSGHGEVKEPATDRAERRKAEKRSPDSKRSKQVREDRPVAQSPQK